jgi:hypothetical protein
MNNFFFQFSHTIASLHKNSELTKTSLLPFAGQTGPRQFAKG